MKKTFTFWKSLFLLCALIVGSSSAWAAENDTHDFAQTISQSLNSGAKPSNIKIAEQSYTVKQVIVTYAYNKTNDVRCAVTVNGTSWGEQEFSGTSNLTTYSTLTFQGAGVKGEILISFANNKVASSGMGTLKVTNIRLVEGPAESSDPSINALDITIDADEKSGEIPYSIINPDESTLTATEKGDGYDWIDNVAVDATNSKVTFTTTENTGAERSGVIVLTYGSVSKEVTVTQSAPVTKYNVTILAPENGTLVVKRGETTVNTGDKFPQGTVLNVTATPNEGYKFRNWQAVDNSTHTYTASNIGTWTMTESDVTLKANFDPIPQYEYSWKVNGTEVKSETLYEEDDVVFPAVADIGGKVFYGWVTTSTVNPDEAPSLEKTTGVKASANTTYYAVFADKEGDGVDTYEKLSSNQFDTDATYVIGSMNGNNLALFYSYNNTVDSEASWGKMSTNYTTNPPLKFTLSGTASALYVKDNNGNYLQGKVNNFRMVSEANKSTITLAEDGTLHDIQSANNTQRWLRYNTDTSYGLRWYATSNTTTGNLAYFYKVIPGYTYSNYCTVVYVTVTPGKTYTTLTSEYNLDFTSVSNDLKAFIAVNGISGTTVKMTQVNKVPAGTGLVLKATTPGAAVNVPVFDGTGADDVSGNMMVGSATETTAIEKDGGYILKDGVFQPASAGTLAAGKAYLAIAVSSARSLEMSFEDTTTGINGVEEVAPANMKTRKVVKNGRLVIETANGEFTIDGARMK